jgi:hypothetical protein
LIDKMLDKAMRLLYSAVFAIITSIMLVKIFVRLLEMWQYSPLWVNWLFVGAPLMVVVLSLGLFFLGYRWLSQEQRK